jgi:hypothetical protein
MGREQHSWLVVNQGTPEHPDYVLADELTPAAMRSPIFRGLGRRLRPGVP